MGRQEEDMKAAAIGMGGVREARGLDDVRENLVVNSTTAEQSENESRKRLWGWVLRVFGDVRRSGGWW